MAKNNVVQIKLVSTADTGYFYVTKKNARAQGPFNRSPERGSSSLVIVCAVQWSCPP